MNVPGSCTIFDHVAFVFITISYSFINFALAPSGGGGGASLAGCPIPDPTPATDPPTIAPPPSQLVTKVPGWEMSVKPDKHLGYSYNF